MLRVGDWVRVRSKEDILRTLDHNCCLDGMPFMPEMFSFCGQSFQVYKSAHKTCDTVFPVRGRRVMDAVHLDLRCDGATHGGCQAGCLLFWKHAWLERVDGRTSQPKASASPAGATLARSEADVIAATRITGVDEKSIRYVCQATQLPYATSTLEWYELSQYWEDYRSGNVGLWKVIAGACYFLFLWLSRAGIGLGKPIRFVYDRLHPLWGGTPYPRRTGRISDGKPTPVSTLNLQPGELVRIKPYAEILETLDERNRNRGLFFDAEEVPYCGKTYEVLRRVERIIDERTGFMRHMKTPCVILNNVICQSRYSECRLFCPRSIYSYWREIWLERVIPQQDEPR